MPMCFTYKKRGVRRSTLHRHVCILVLIMFGIIKKTLSVPRLIHALKMTMFIRYEEFFFASFKGTFLKDNCNTKLRTYCKFKKTYTFENYLGVSVDKNIISQYSK